MVSRVATVAFRGMEAVPVDVQVHMASGVVAFSIVGLGDKAVAESRERVRAALSAIGLALPAKRITVNLAPADLPKEGSHYDLPIAVGLLTAMGLLPVDFTSRYLVLGELSLDGKVEPVNGVLPAAMAANARDLGLICPQECGPEAAWAADDLDILPVQSLVQILNHMKGNAGAVTACSKTCRKGGVAARPERRQGPGKRQTGTGGRCRWRAPHADGRPARCRQVHAGLTHAVHPAADGRWRNA
jgi:predicted ATPase with chaperone activity